MVILSFLLSLIICIFECCSWFQQPTQCPFLMLFMWGFLIPIFVHFFKVFLLFLLFFFPPLFIFPGWTVYHQTSERVTYKSSSKPRTRFLSGPVSLSICLYLFFSIPLCSFFHTLYLTWFYCHSFFFLKENKFSSYFFPPFLQAFSPDTYHCFPF